MRSNRGSGLATVLLVMAVLAAIALALASSTTFHLRLANRQSMGAQSRNLAESTLARAIDLLMDQRDLGAQDQSEDDVVTVQLEPGGPTGLLSFYAPTAEEHAVPVSINNLESDHSVVMEDGRVVPPFSAYLAARADCGGVGKIMERVLRIPVYKYSIATSGNIVSNGRLLVASIDKDTDLSQGLGAVPLDQLKPGHLAAQSTEQTVLDSVSPATESLITGDVVSGGAVTLGPFTNVKGSVKQNHKPEDLPDLDVTTYDPEGWAGLQTMGLDVVNQDQPLDPLELEGVWRRSGDLEIAGGGLKLDGGYLYVDGDLQIDGAVSGKGSIFCTGNISVGRASGFATDNVQAMVAGGSISIQGGASTDSRNSSFFSGILFSHGGMNLSNVTVVGSVINNSPEDSVMTLNNVALLSNPEVLTFDLGLPGTPQIKTLAGTNSDYIFNFKVVSEDFAQYFNKGQDRFDIPQKADISLTVYLTDALLFNGSEQLIGTYSSAVELLQGIEEMLGSSYVQADYNNEQDTDLIELETQTDTFRKQFQQALENANDLYERNRQESLRRGQFSLEPNQFLPFADRARVIWSKEIDPE